MILQVKPCYLPELQAAMCQRVKVGFGVVELDPGTVLAFMLVSEPASDS
jgi:hypothetical protein